jgi:energy-coupling factor transporter transmembrane protein EcfT
MRNGAVLLSAGPLMITWEGVYAGTVFAGRLLLMMMSANLLVRTSRPEDLLKASRILLLPARAIGLSPDRLTAIMALAWEFLPVLGQRCRRAMAGQNLAQGHKRLLSRLADVLASIYLEEGPFDANARSSTRRDA